MIQWAKSGPQLVQSITGWCDERLLASLKHTFWGKIPFNLAPHITNWRVVRHVAFRLWFWAHVGAQRQVEKSRKLVLNPKVTCSKTCCFSEPCILPLTVPSCQSHDPSERVVLAALSAVTAWHSQDSLQLPSSTAL